MSLCAQSALPSFSLSIVIFHLFALHCFRGLLVDSWRLRLRHLDQLQRSGHEAQPANARRDTSEDDQRPIASTICKIRMFPNPTLQQGLTQWATQDIANAPSSGQKAEQHTQISRSLFLLGLTNDPRPRRGEGSREQSVQNAEQVQRTQTDRETPDQQGRDHGSDGRDGNAGSHVVSISQSSHHDTANHGCNIDQDQGQGRRHGPGSETSRIRRQVDLREEESQCLHSVACLEDEERA